MMGGIKDSYGKAGFRCQVSGFRHQVADGEKGRL